MRSLALPTEPKTFQVEYKEHDGGDLAGMASVRFIHESDPEIARKEVLLVCLPQRATRDMELPNGNCHGIGPQGTMLMAEVTDKGDPISLFFPGYDHMRTSAHSQCAVANFLSVDAVFELLITGAMPTIITLAVDEQDRWCGLRDLHVAFASHWRDLVRSDIHGVPQLSPSNMLDSPMAS